MKKKAFKTKKNTWKTKWVFEAEDVISVAFSVFAVVFVLIQVMR